MYLYRNIRTSTSRSFYYKMLLWNFKYYRVQIENVSYWFTSKTILPRFTVRRHVFLIGFPITVSKREILD